MVNIIILLALFHFIIVAFYCRILGWKTLQILKQITVMVSNEVRRGIKKNSEKVLSKDFKK